MMSQSHGGRNGVPQLHPSTPILQMIAEETAPHLYHGYLLLTETERSAATCRHPFELWETQLRTP